MSLLSGTQQDCGNCKTQKAWVLHYVRLRGIHRILCTNCVLRLHPTSFCPSCFAFYDASPPHTSRRLPCAKCHSFTHTRCVPSSSASAFATTSPSFYLCPPCTNPTSSFFDLKVRNDGIRFVDKKLADALLCAAKIAAGSMVKAVSVARGEAERKVRESALARKRAREALEHVATLVGSDNARDFVTLQLKQSSFEISSHANISGSTDDFKPKTERDSKIKNRDNGAAGETDIYGISDKVDNHNQNGEEAKHCLPMGSVKQENVGFN